ncbi:MAG: DNA-directed RNA polymerase subunit L [Methermicoccaceae archaeon]
MCMFLVLKKSDTELKIKLLDETHTLANLLTELLLEDERVDVAYYNVEFPSMSNPVLYISTHGEDPLRVLVDASNRIAELCDEFTQVFTSAYDSFAK